MGLGKVYFSQLLKFKIISSVNFKQGTHCTGKTGIMAKKIPVRVNTGNLETLPKHRGNTGKTQGIWFAQVVNSLILKVNDISKFAAKFFF